MDNARSSSEPVRFNAESARQFDLPDRAFRMHAFFQGHSQLLLRAERHAGYSVPQYPTRIDILFKAVEFVKLPTTMRGFSLSTATPGDGSVAEAWLPRSFGPGSEVFVVRGSDYEGYVVAAAAYLCEDEVEDGYAPSALTKDFRIVFTPLTAPEPGDTRAR